MANTVTPQAFPTTTPPLEQEIKKGTSLWIPRAGEPGKKITWEQTERKQQRKFYESGRREETLQSIEDIVKKKTELSQTDKVAIGHILDEVKTRGTDAINKKGIFFKKTRISNLEKRIEFLKTQIKPSTTSDTKEIIPETFERPHIIELHKTIYSQIKDSLKHTDEQDKIDEIKDLYKAKAAALKELDKYPAACHNSDQPIFIRALIDMIKTSDNATAVTSALELFKSQMTALQKKLREKH